MTTMPAASRIPGLIAWTIAVLVSPAVFLVAAFWGRLDLGSGSIQVFASVMFLLVSPAYAFTGAVVVSRQPRNSVGWVLVGVAVGISFSIISEIMLPSQTPSTIDVWLLLFVGFQSVSWVFFVFPIFHLLLVFPTGKVLTPRWRAFVALEVVMVLFMVFAVFFGETLTATEDAWSVANPIGFIPNSFFGAAFGLTWSSGLLLLTVGGLTSIVLRFVRAGSQERQQIKWLMFAVGLFAVVYGGSAAQTAATGADTLPLFDVLFPISVIAIALSIGFALLRYRLYDVDRIISRTVGYALVAGLLGLLVAVVSALVGSRFQNPPIVAATTLAVAALFTPLRKRVQRLVDRRFGRSPYDAERVVTDFARDLGSRVEQESVIGGWCEVVNSTMHPSAMGVWVRP